MDNSRGSTTEARVSESMDQPADNPAECLCGNTTLVELVGVHLPARGVWAFDSAVSDLRSGAGRALSRMQFTAYANDLARKYLLRLRDRVSKLPSWGRDQTMVKAGLSRGRKNQLLPMLPRCQRYNFPSTGPA